jgi:tripartite-type tricarboxylate transporter receptor subunit TctC
MLASRPALQVVQAVFLSCVLAAPVQSVLAQTYPTRPIRIICPYVAGGGSDFVARTIAQKLTETIGQSVIVDNRPGGGTNIGAELVARAAPDGYTIFLGGTPTTVNVTLYKKLPFDVINDFAPITMTTVAPNLLVVHPSLPVRAVKELIALAKARPGQLTYGSAGIASSNHLSGALFKTMAGIDIVHVPYKGGGAAVTDLLAGNISMYFSTTPSSMPHVRTGRLRALAVTSAKRSDIVPNIPTMAEAALPGFEMSAWHALFAPAATPPAVLKKLADEVVRALRQPDVKERLAAQGVDAVGTTPEELAAIIKENIAKYAKLVKAADIRIE